MTMTRDWQRHRKMRVRVLEKQTGAGVGGWKESIRKRSFADARTLRAWACRGGPLIAWFKDPAGNILSVLDEAE